VDNNVVASLATRTVKDESVRHVHPYFSDKSNLSFSKWLPNANFSLVETGK